MQNQTRFWVPLLLFIAVWLPRTFTLDAFVSTDEQKWLTRSANFYRALATQDWENTFQREHPGVTVMHAGMLGIIQQFPAYAQVAPAQFNWEGGELEQFLAQQPGITPLALLAAGRWWAVLITSLVLTLGYFPLRRLFGVGVAAAITLYVGWDPFGIGLSRLLHPDGMAAGTIYLALLLWLAWLYTGRGRSHLITAGVAMGLAWLTKTPAIFLVPVGAILIASQIGRQWLTGGRRSTASYLLGYVAWGVIATCTFILLWPAMWVDPLGTLLRMWAEMYVYMDHHDVVNFYRGNLVADPGPAFYLTAWHLRTTPTTLVGVPLFALILIGRQWPLVQKPARQATFGLLLFVILFTVGMSLGAKKFDRYLLPAILVIDVFALLGWAGAIRWAVTRLRLVTVPRWGQRGGQFFVPVFCTLLFGARLGLSLQQYPYYLTYYNSVFGGGKAAAQQIMTGWGEGLDAAARWINAQPDGKNARVASWYNIGPLSYFLESKAPTFDFWRTDFWTEADYAVVYVNQAQRDLPDAALVDYLQQAAPAHTVMFRGNPLAWIYDLRTMLPPTTVDIAAEKAANVDNAMRLAGFRVEPTALFTDEDLRVQLYLEALTPLPAEYEQLLQLVDAHGAVIWQAPMQPTAGADKQWPAGAVRRLQSTVAMPRAIPAGQYDLQLRHESPLEPGARLGATQDDRAYTLTPLDLYTPVDVPTVGSWPGAQLTQVRHSATLGAEHEILVDLHFSGPVDARCKLSLRLQDAAGNTIAQVDKPLAARLRFSLEVPAAALTGKYTLLAVVYDPVTMNSIPDQDGSHIVSLIDTLTLDN